MEGESNTLPNLTLIDMLFNPEEKAKSLSVGNTDLSSWENTLEDTYPSQGYPFRFGNKAPMHRDPSEIIHGPDDRKKIGVYDFPYKCIALLKIQTSEGRIIQGTGFFISKRCIITAGHCVFHEGEWVYEITVIPGVEAEKEKFGRAISRKFRSVIGWTEHKDENFDFGAIILEDNKLFNSVRSYLGYNIISQEQNIRISGYSRDKYQTQWESEGLIEDTSDHKLYYKLDTEEGNSGSPIFISKSDGRFKQVIGLHTYGDALNSGIKLTQLIMDRWNEWTQL